MMTNKPKSNALLGAMMAVVVVIIGLYALVGAMPDWLRKTFKFALEGLFKWIFGAGHVNHVTDFVGAISSLDLLIGRSWLQGLVIVFTTVACTFLGGAWKWGSAKSFTGLVFGYFCGVILGMVFELLRTSDFQEMQEYSSIVLGCVIAVTMVSLALNHQFFRRLGVTLRGRVPRLVGQKRGTFLFLWHFFWQRQLHPDLLGESRVASAEQVPIVAPALVADTTPGTTTGTPGQATPAEEAEETEAAPKLRLVDFELPAMVKCPQCRQWTPAEARFCGHCQPPVRLRPEEAGEPAPPAPPAEPAAPPALQADLQQAERVKCPKCHKWVPAEWRFCGHCQPPVRLRPEEAERPAATREGKLPRSLIDFLQETTP